MKRGDLVTVVSNGDYGKPRPALVIQSDLFDQHPSIIVLPITSHLEESLIFRFRLFPDSENNLKTESDIMIDKCFASPRDKLREPFGWVNDEILMSINKLLIVFLGIA